MLLARPKAKREIVNDYDERIVAWWIGVRDHNDELCRMIHWTPVRSRTMFEDAIRVCSDEWDGASPVERAYAVTVYLEMGFCHALRPHPGMSLVSGATGFCAAASRLRLLRERIVNVRLECGDGVALAARFAGDRDAVLYLDPPYEDANPNYGVGFNDPLVEPICEAVADASAAVAISGYGDTFDRLGWHRSERTVPAASTRSAPGGSKPRRVEVLWTNFRPARAQGQLL